ncbi:hypothetical protein ABT324_24190 [Saccharopolyspora sp. NPDC000359]|uniref:hypothetical protein n=1 Tax=Saccharopolyspora sp. NPDC000359 TaxID=3154251 RepID=UPI00332DB4AD
MQDYDDDPDFDSLDEDEFEFVEEFGSPPPDEPDLDDFDDESAGQGKEEPDCFDCNDAGCRSCDPTPFQQRVDNIRAKLAPLFHRVYCRFVRRDQLDDEPPF